MKGPIMKISKLGTAILVVFVGLFLSGCQAKDDDVDVEDNFQSLKTLTATEGADYDNFGLAVALDGDLALVGSPGDDTAGMNAGAAYLFARTEGGADGWGEVKKLVAADAAAGDLFGIAVDIDGDYAVIAAASEDGAGTDRGAVYIFYKDQGGANAWGQVARLRASDAANGDDFGCSVAIDGTTVVVGAEAVAGDTAKEGAAYVFLKDQGGLDYWGQAAKLVSDDPGDSDQYGYSVDVSGDIAVVGAPGENGSGANRGAVRVYARDLGGANAWGLVKKISASDQSDDSWFGTSVAIRGTRLVVGAPWADGAGTDRGAAYLLGRDVDGADAWGQIKLLTASDPQDNDLFAFDVALYGDYVLASAPYARGGGTERGQVYAFAKDEGGADGWGEAQRLRSSDGRNEDHFGVSIAVSGSYALAGATGHDGAGTERGAAYVFKEI
jgi:hypothetical protein